MSNHNSIPEDEFSFKDVTPETGYRRPAVDRPRPLAPGSEEAWPQSARPLAPGATQDTWPTAAPRLPARPVLPLGEPPSIVPSAREAARPHPVTRPDPMADSEPPDDDEPPARQGPRVPYQPAADEEAPPPVLSQTAISPRHQLEAWLAVMSKAGASDLILRAGGRPCQRVDGKITFLSGRVPDTGPFLDVLEGILGKDRMEMWRQRGSADAALHLDGLGRFRLNAYRQMGEPAVVIRRINEKPPLLDQLNLPADSLKKLALRKRGLILVTGIAGSGKSTTLAGMIQSMNESLERHIVTLEDPIELMFREKRCVISQREIGTDCSSFQDGLRHALRQSPDVILIGEMRDAETVIAALDATETGHLVMSTLHTVNAPQTVERILSFFRAEQHSQVRMRLSENLAGVLSQRLIPRAGGKGMIPAFELMQSTPHIRELLVEGKTSEIGRVIEQGTEKGLISFNMCLRRLVQERSIELDDALAASDRPEELILALRGITGSSGRPEVTKNPQRPPAGGGGDGLRISRRE
ncbi:MAG: PilT/PilU family type 4a pilus ATPase [Planctomycetes bacterium]|nr:PilT/PilU family type 4a pilus ATPase [Planctomycetota bacterium]